MLILKVGKVFAAPGRDRGKCKVGPALSAFTICICAIFCNLVMMKSRWVFVGLVVISNLLSSRHIGFGDRGACVFLSVLR